VTPLRPDMHWELKQGRDTDGDRYCHYLLIHTPTNRLLIKVIAPAENCQYTYSMYVYTSCAKKLREDSFGDDSDVRFMALEDTQDYAQMLVKDFRSHAV